MPNDKSSDNILTAGEEEMTLGGRLYASRQNSGLLHTELIMNTDIVLKISKAFDLLAA